MTRDPLELVERAFRAIEARDITAALSCFAEDAVLIDPHYPEPRMVGPEAIAAGLGWALSTLRQMRFHPVGVFVSADGESLALEVETAHVVRGGLKLQFSQTFVIETRGEQITRWQTYTPYGPPGVGGVLLRLTRLWRRRPWRE